VKIRGFKNTFVAFDGKDSQAKQRERRCQDVERELAKAKNDFLGQLRNDPLHTAMAKKTADSCQMGSVVACEEADSQLRFHPTTGVPASWVISGWCSATLRSSLSRATLETLVGCSTC
jgi:uncharacterized protein YbbK (DUF523 family)